MNKQKIAVFWFRRDLRLEDNVGLTAALKLGLPILPVFIFDKEILDKLPKDDARVTFLHDTLQKIRGTLQKNFNTSLGLYYGTPEAVFKQLLDTYDIQSVHTNGDYEPYARKRDAAIEALLAQKQVRFNTYKDQVIFEKNDIVKNDGKPYVVYTPYKNKWKEHFIKESMLKEHSPIVHMGNLFPDKRLPNISLSEMGFGRSTIEVPDYIATPSLIEGYEDTRNFPAIKNGTSRLGPHLRFGTAGH